MNCANHPEAPVAAYCQFCGKPLCDKCIHKVGNIISCEPCLTARIHGAIPGAYASSNAGPPPPAGAPAHAAWGTEPWLAFILGWVPGVGAMYNGQFAKGLAHVVIFAVLVNLAHYNGFVGLMVAAWVFYQVFDAYQTAIARRDGLPLPDPLGLDNIGHWFGPRNYPVRGDLNPTNFHPETGGPKNPVPPNPVADRAPGGQEFTPAGGPFPQEQPPYGSPPLAQSPYHTRDFPHSHNGHGMPVGAVILILLGGIFLLNNLGIFSDYWIDRGWPILLIALGVWIVIRRSQKTNNGGTQ